MAERAGLVAAGGARLVAACAVLAGLAGCAPSRPQGITLETPAPPPSGIAGRYRGTARLIRSDNRFCPRSGPRVYELQDGSVTFSYQGPGRARIPLTASVQPNGDFDSSDGEGRLQGHVGDGQLSVTIASRECEHHWTMHHIE